MSREEVQFMQRFKIGELEVAAGTTILLEGSTSPQLFTVLYGLGLRYKLLEDGRRQVVNFVFPGEFIGLQAGVMGEMRHTVEASTAMTLCVFSRSDLWTVFRSAPGRAFDLTWLAAQEEHFLGETLATLGQRNGVERMAWGLLKLFQKADSLNLVTAGTMRFPFRQADLADALGLSVVHANRTLKRLRETQLLSLGGGVLTVNDVEGLAEMAGSTTEPPERRPLF
jgi:CRP/FNR family transcriptional regulator, anaerobic regulatory protein